MAAKQQAQPQCASSSSKGTTGIPAYLRCEAHPHQHCCMCWMLWLPITSGNLINSNPPLNLKEKKNLKIRVLFPLGNPQHWLRSDHSLGPGCAKQTESCPNGAAKISCSCRGNFTIDIPAHGQPNDGMWRREGSEAAGLCPVPHWGQSHCCPVQEELGRGMRGFIEVI